MYQCGYILKDQVELRKTNFKVKLQSIIPFIYVFETERNAIYYLLFMDTYKCIYTRYLRSSTGIIIFSRLIFHNKHLRQNEVAEIKNRDVILCIKFKVQS